MPSSYIARFELNRMIATEFWVGSGNSSERKFLESVLEKGITYIAERGYFSFDLLDKVLQARAFFVFRGKANLLYTRGWEVNHQPSRIARLF